MHEIKPSTVSRYFLFFFQEMGREQEKSEHILIQMKNYDAEAQKQTREKQLQEFLYQQTLVYFYVKG